MPIQTIEPRRLYRQIADQLRALIERGEYAVGTRLPPERELAQQFGVSRPSVREALIALEIEGRVEVRMGSGVVVTPAPAGRVAPAGGEGPLETLRARQLIESELAALAAQRMDAAQVAALRDDLVLMREEAAAGRVPVHGDRLFHLRIAQASDNAVLQRLVGELFDERHSPLYARLGSHFETDRSWSAAIAEHHAVVDAIAARSPDAARAAMAAHLARSHDRYTAGIGHAGAAPRARVPAGQRRRAAPRASA